MIKASKLDEETRLIYPNGVDLHRDFEVSSDGVIFEAFLDSKVLVDRLLDYSDLRLGWYIPSETAIKFMIFIRMSLGEEPENSNSKPQYFMIDVILQSNNVKPFFMARNIDFDNFSRETVVLCSREFSKSTLVTYFLLFMATEGKLPKFGRINYGLYVSDSMRNGVKKMMGRLKGIYNESVYLQSIFEDVTITQEEAVFIRHPRTKREVELYDDFVNAQGKKAENVPGRMKRTFKVDGLGCATSSRGASNVLSRPQFVFIDDVVANETDATSKTILDSIESTIESDIRGGLSGAGYFIVAIGTPFNKMDPIYRRVEEGLMLPVVFPRAVKPPTEDPKEFEGVWEDRHSYKKCKKEYSNALKAKKDGNTTKFRSLMQEHYLRISSEEDKMIPDSLIQWFDRTLTMKALQNYSLYITTDFTTTTNSLKDFSALGVWAVNSNGDWFLLDLCVRRQGIGEQYDELFRMIRTWSSKGATLEVGIEVDGNQRAHIHALKAEMNKRNLYFTLARQKGSRYGFEGILSKNGGRDKHSRFRMILPQFQNKKVYFAEQLKETPDMTEALEELNYVTHFGFSSAHDDFCDIVSQLGLIEIVTPLADSFIADTPAGRQDSIWDDIFEDEPSAYDSY